MTWPTLTPSIQMSFHVRLPWCHQQASLSLSLKPCSLVLSLVLSPQRRRRSQVETDQRAAQIELNLRQLLPALMGAPWQQPTSERQHCFVLSATALQPQRHMNGLDQGLPEPIVAASFSGQLQFTFLPPALPLKKKHAHLRPPAETLPAVLCAVVPGQNLIKKINSTPRMLSKYSMMQCKTMYTRSWARKPYSHD